MDTTKWLIEAIEKLIECGDFTGNEQLIQAVLQGASMIKERESRLMGDQSLLQAQLTEKTLREVHVVLIKENVKLEQQIAERDQVLEDAIINLNLYNTRAAYHLRTRFESLKQKGD